MSRFAWLQPLMHLHSIYGYKKYTFLGSIPILLCVDGSPKDVKHSKNYFYTLEGLSSDSQDHLIYIYCTYSESLKYQFLVSLFLRLQDNFYLLCTLLHCFCHIKGRGYLLRHRDIPFYFLWVEFGKMESWWFRPVSFCIVQIGSQKYILGHTDLWYIYRYFLRLLLVYFGILRRDLYQECLLILWYHFWNAQNKRGKWQQKRVHNTLLLPAINTLFFSSKQRKVWWREWVIEK